jgi:hypothetical protein
MSDTPRSITLVAGASQTGKTTFALRYLLNTKADYVFMFDHDGEFSRRLHYPAADSAAALAHQLTWGWVDYDPSEMFPGQTAAALAFYCEWVWEVCRSLPGRKVLFVDELTRWTSPHSITPSLSTIVENGRKRGVQLMFTSNRPATTNSAILGQLTELVAFQLPDIRLGDWLSSYGFDFESVRRLPKFHFQAVNLDTWGRLSGRLP